MDNLGDWIYIVFLIVAALSGLFSSKNKKKHPTQVLGQPEYETAQEEATPSDKGFWEMLEGVKKERPKPQTVTKTVSAVNPFLAAEQEIHKSKIKSSRPIQPEEEHSILQDIEFNNIDELRKAVIYSEILNRKY